jgi:cytochrome c oxidase cbb3-type subunit 2
MSETPKNAFYKIEKSAIVTFIGIVLLFSGAVGVTLIAPSYVDPTWTSPTSPYQVQMYEVSDPNLYISSTETSSSNLQFVYHLKRHFTLLAFQESESVKIIAPEELQHFVTKADERPLKLTSELLLLRIPTGEAAKTAEDLRLSLQKDWKSQQPKPDFQIFELYKVDGDEIFSVAPKDSMFENWVDNDYVILDKTTQQHYHKDPGVIFISNPIEYRVSEFSRGEKIGFRYDPAGAPIANLQQLEGLELGFRSRKELIEIGEHIYAIEGCWYCHTDQTRTLIQDVVLNGSDSYPAPPSSANEYIYQKITFPGTKRNGPDISRVGVKRPSRDWHKGHFWSPKTASAGSIMPAFQHFFDTDPRGTAKNTTGIPNYRFEAIYQYLMTKGTRITPPTQAWWLGADPINTKAIIEGRKKLK